jgi:hypothetical protein
VSGATRFTELGFKFPVDINGLMTVAQCPEHPFLLASPARILYPVGLPRIRAAPAVFFAGRLITCRDT